MKRFKLLLGGSQGLGLEIAKEILRSGDELIIIGKSDFPSINNLNIKSLHLIKSDFSVSGEDEIERTIRELEQMIGTNFIDQFIWNAGYLKRIPSTQIPSHEVLKMIDINFRNPSLLAFWAWHQMQIHNHGHFAVISSTAGISDKPRDDEAVYAATKAAQVAFTRALGKNLTPSKLKVSLFCPGGMQTNLWKDNWQEPELLKSFSDPKKVALKIINEMKGQIKPYEEFLIPRGSL